MHFLPAMTKKIEAYFFGLLLVFIVGCDVQKDKNVETDKKEAPISIELREKEENLVKNFSDLFTNSSIIPLRINDSLIIASVKKIIVYKSNYFVLDNKFSTLYRFDDKGNFLTTYGKIGLGPGEFRRIDDFDIDSVNNRILILSNDDLAIYYYAIGNTSFLKKQRIGCFGTSLSVLPNNKILIFINYNNNEKNDKHNVVLIDSASNIIQKYFPFDAQKSTMMFTATGFMQKTDNKVFFSSAFDDTIYVYNNEKFSTYAYIDINSDFIQKNKFEHEKIINSGIMMDPGTSFLGSTFLKNDDYLIFSFQKKKRRKFGFFKIKEGKMAILSKEVEGDPLIKLFQEPVYLGRDNAVIFGFSPEIVANLKKNNSPVFDKLSAEQKKILDDGDMASTYYLLVSRIKD